MRRVLVSGAGGALGRHAARMLIAQKVEVVAGIRTRNPHAESELAEIGAVVTPLDLTDAASLRDVLQTVDGAIFFPILTVSHRAVDLLRGDQRAIFFSSNNVGVDPGAPVYADLIRAEKIVRASGARAQILRPTMIYGYPGDGNLSRLFRVYRRWGWAMTPGNGGALQQPVYYKDAAKIAVDLLLGNATSPIASLAGPNAVTQRDLYIAVARSAGRHPRILSGPIAPAIAFAKLCERLNVRLPVTSHQLLRASLDKTPRGDAVINGETSLDAGLRALALDLDAWNAGA